jgi:hypothetical protein
MRGNRSEEGGVVGGEGEINLNSSSMRSFADGRSKLDFRIPGNGKVPGPPTSEVE